MGKVALTICALAAVLSAAYAVPPFYGPGMPGMLDTWAGHMDDRPFRKNLVSMLEAKCRVWQSREFEDLGLTDDQQMRVRDLCDLLDESYTAPLELINLMYSHTPGMGLAYADPYEDDQL